MIIIFPDISRIVYPHIEFHGADSKLKCTQCQGSEEIKTPVYTTDFFSKINRFVEQHKNCKK